MSAVLDRESLRELSARAGTSLVAMVVAAAVVVAALGLYDSDYVTIIALSVATYAALGLGLNIVMGYAGLLDMGYAAFFAIGAYTSAICTLHWGLNFFASVPIAVAVTALAGIVIGYPTLRLRPDYLAIVTIGFGELVRTAVNNWDFAGASRGLYPLPVPTLGPLEFVKPIESAILAFGLLAIVLVISTRLGQSAIGRAWRAIRDDDFASEAIGLPTLRLKLGAYISGGAVGALAGSIFSARSVAIDPTSFTLSLSVQIVMIVVVGGLASTRGVLVASVLFVVLPEVLRFVQDYRILIFSVVVILMVHFRPEGIIPAPRYRRPARATAVGDGRPPRVRGVDRTEPVLVLTDVSQQFAGLKALDRVSIEVLPGRVTGIIGPNGAGKSTLVNAITGVVPAKGGSVTLLGEDITTLRPHEISARGVGRTFQTSRLLDSMSVLENVMIGDYQRSRSHLRTVLFGPRATRAAEALAASRALAALERLSMADAADRLPGELSYADRRRVEIARALNADPVMLVLDEPAAGMNPAEKNDLAGLLAAITETGVAVVLIEHDMPLVSTIATDVVVLDHGQLLAQGPPAEVLARPEVIEAYLGPAVGKDDA